VIVLAPASARKSKSRVSNSETKEGFLVKLHLIGAAILVLAAAPALAEDATVKLVLKDHQFVPREPTTPAGKPIAIQVTNQDKTPSEFESKTLRVEKVVPAGGTITLRVRALTPGRYRFFDDYHEDTTEGFLVVQ
jgi:heme/copper-type cytochrome/quinol oxidase subunit 2